MRKRKRRRESTILPECIDSTVAQFPLCLPSSLSLPPSLSLSLSRSPLLVSLLHILLHHLGSLSFSCSPLSSCYQLLHPISPAPSPADIQPLALSLIPSLCLALFSRVAPSYKFIGDLVATHSRPDRVTTVRGSDFGCRRNCVRRKARDVFVARAAILSREGRSLNYPKRKGGTVIATAMYSYRMYFARAISV